METCGNGNGDQPVVTNGKFEYQWHDHGSQLRGIVNHMFYSGSLVDVTIACPDGSIRGHQMILAAFSPYFQALFASNPCRHPVVFLHGAQLPVVKALMDFIYQGTVTCSVVDVGGILDLAKSLQIRGLDHLASFSSSSSTTAFQRPSASSSRCTSGQQPSSGFSFLVPRPVLCSSEDGPTPTVAQTRAQGSRPKETVIPSVDRGSCLKRALQAPPVMPVPFDGSHLRKNTSTSLSWGPISPEMPASATATAEREKIAPAVDLDPSTSVPPPGHVEPEPAAVPLNLSPDRHEPPRHVMRGQSVAGDGTTSATMASSRADREPDATSPPPPTAPPLGDVGSRGAPCNSKPQRPPNHGQSRKSSKTPAQEKLKKIVKTGVSGLVKKRGRGRPRTNLSEVVTFVCLEEEGKSRYNAMYNKKARDLGLQSGWDLMEDRVRKTLRGNSKDRSKGIMEKSRMILKFRIPENLIKLSEGGTYDYYIPETGARGNIHDPEFSAQCRILTLKALVRQTQFALKEEQLNYIKEGNMAAASCYGRRAVTESLHLLAISAIPEDAETEKSALKPNLHSSLSQDSASSCGNDSGISCANKEEAAESISVDTSPSLTAQGKRVSSSRCASPANREQCCRQSNNNGQRGKNKRQRLANNSNSLSASSSDSESRALNRGN